MSEDLNKKINELTQNISKIVEDGSKTVMDTISTTGKKVMDTFDLEKKKAEIRSEIGHNSRDLSKAYEKLGRDYDRLNRLELQIEKTRTVQISMSEELEIIMEALLGALGGLQELGANGPTKEAKAKIQDYLNRKAHHSDTDDFE